MKRATIVLTVILLLSIVSSAAAGTGNGAPSGAHYNLNIIGVPKGKNPNMSGDSGHRIFVLLDKKGELPASKIILDEAPDDETFAVVDANGTDGEAEFMLPNPDPENTGTSWYSVWARAVGTPGGQAYMTTCAYDGDVKVCSMAVLDMDRPKGKVDTFGDVSRNLLYIYYDLDADGVVEHYNIFNDALEGYFWEYDNNGLKVLQLRFYPGEPSTVPGTWPFPE